MPPNRGRVARPDEIRRHNRELLLGHLHRDGALTRAQLTQRLHLSRSTVGALVSDLEDLGLVEEVVPNGGTGVGRPSHLVAPRPGGPFAVGVDIDVAHVTVAAVGLGGAILARRVVPTGGAAVAEDVARLIGEAVPALQDSLGPGARPCGLGVSVPGTVDRRTGHVRVAPNLAWQDVQLGSLLAAVLPPELPVVLGNDADLAVLAEHQRGSARGCDDVVFVMGRIGVGAGIIAGGVPMRGRTGNAGEIGHNVLDPAGPRCHCGKRGCIETYVGEVALLELAGRPLPRTDRAVNELFADARAGEPRAVAAIRGAGEPLGRAIAHLLNILNPERVVLGGSIGVVLELAADELAASVERYSFGTAAHDVGLVLPELGADSALLGAAEMGFAELLGAAR